MDAQKPPAEKSEGRIQSLERAAAIMEEAARHADGVTLSELSRTLGLHTSTLYHLTRTLVALGYLRTGPDDKRYRIGRGIFQLASACLDEAELCATVEPFLDRRTHDALGSIGLFDDVLGELLADATLGNPPAFLDVQARIEATLLDQFDVRLRVFVRVWLLFDCFFDCFFD